MADITIRTHRLPDGTEVEAYPRTNWPGQRVKTDAAPLGSPEDSKTVTGNFVTFTGLDESAEYVAHAEIGGQHRYVGFRAGRDTGPISRAEFEERASGRELGYAEITANHTVTTTQADVAGLLVEVEVGVRPVIVKFDAFYAQLPATAGAALTVLITDAAGTALSAARVQNPAAAVAHLPMHREVRLNPTPGTYTYKVRAVISSGTGLITATTAAPTFLQVVEV